MNKTIIYIVFASSITSGNAAEMINTPITPALPAKSLAITQELEILNLFKKAGINDEKIKNNPSLKDVEKMRAIIKKFIHRKDLDATFARTLISNYFIITLMSAKSLKDLDDLQDEMNQLISTNLELAETLKAINKAYFDQGSEALFIQTQAIREEFNRKLSSPSIAISPERKVKLRKEYDEIREAIRKNRAVISIEHPTQEEFIRRRDTLEPFLACKDLEPETILMLIDEYNISATRANKTPADIEKSKQLLEKLAQNHPKSAKLIRSIIQLTYRSK